MKKYLFLVLILSFASILQALSSSPVEVSISQRPLTDAPVLELIIELNIPEGLHVYASETNFFNVAVERSSNLGKKSLKLPSTKPYKNFDGSIVDVFSGRQYILVSVPYTAEPGSPFAIEGYFQFQGCSDTICYPPQKIPFSFEGIVPENAVPNQDFSKETVPYARGLWQGILGAFIAGILLSLTPCVYPMIGITAAVIGAKQVSKRQAVLLTSLYILGLSVVYAVVGVIVALIGSTAASFFRSVWVLAPIGVLFVVLGLSMFDLFEISTSSSFSGKVQKVSQKYKGSYAGTFLIGALSAFVVGPCVSGPLISLITFVAVSGDILRGFAYFFSMAWGMGMILFISGTLSGSLPRAGLWMERIKHTIGIVLIWAGFYFVRPFIGEIPFLSASIVAVATGLHALGVISLPAGETNPRKVMVTLIGCVALGLFVYTQISMLPSARLQSSSALQVDLPAIVASASAPIILDFTAPWCTICKEIEETVLNKPEVQNKLRQVIFVKVDYDSNPHLVKQFNIIGPPAFIFLDQQGNQIGHVTVTGKELEQRIFSLE